MYTIEEFLNAGREEIGTILAGARVTPQGDQVARRERLAEQLGVNAAQLVCGCGFNPNIESYDTAIHYLGFSTFEALAAERNYILVHDRYNHLSVNNVLEIYAVLGRDDVHRSASADLVMTRLNNLEAQLEETINPILIGGYKLEIRGIYENGLASQEFVAHRIERKYTVLRDIANECAIMLQTQVVSPDEFLSNEGPTVDEKGRAVFQGLISQDAVERYLAGLGASEDGEKLRAVLASQS